MLIELLGFFRYGMYYYSTDAHYLCRLHCTKHRILQ